MNFLDAIRAGFTNYATFTGRASRPEFWWWILFTALASAALNSFNVATPGGTFLLGSSASGVWAVVVLLPTLAVAVRRLRDAGRSWAELFWLLLPIAGLIVLIVHLCDPPRSVRVGTGPHGELPDPII